MARPIKDNKNVIQSYLLTTAKYDFSVYEKRILYGLVECGQEEIEGIKIKDNMHKIQPTLFGGREITLPITKILKDEKDQHYNIAKKAFKSLSNKTLEYEDDKCWMLTHIINSVHVDKIKGYATFEVPKEIWQCLLDFSQGYRKYELITAMQFKSVYSMRMYELMSGQKLPLIFGFEELKEMFGVKDRYSRLDNFQMRVLDVAKKELDKCSPYSFNYVPVKTGRKTTGFKFFPVLHVENKDAELFAKEQQAKLTGSNQISSAVYDYLRFSLEFGVAEINANKQTMTEGEQTIPDFIGFLAELKAGMRYADNPKGYVINAVKKQTAEIKAAKK